MTRLSGFPILYVRAHQLVEYRISVPTIGDCESVRRLVTSVNATLGPKMSIK
jgi:hypothetical protein